MLIDPAGGPVVAAAYDAPDDEVLVRACRSLTTARRLNDQAYALVRQGRLAVYPSSHGQEACQVAAALVLDEGDWLFPTYRDTVAAVERGVDPVEVLTLLKGDWHSGYDPYQHKVAPQATPLATQLLHAVGVAHAASLRGEKTVVMALCGDGATSEGDFHEALNFAAVFKAPVVFFVQNNEYAISVPLSRQSVAPSLAHKGIGYGVPGERATRSPASRPILRDGACSPTRRWPSSRQMQSRSRHMSAMASTATSSPTRSSCSSMSTRRRRPSSRNRRHWSLTS
jgi:2-oxoisovalerate dehydrogenase E1 component alpha subunit